MPKRLTITVPHALGAAEVRRRIDLHMDWAFRRLEAEKIRVEAEDWLGNRRAFSGSGYGQTARVAIQVADDALEVEALVPWMASLLPPGIESGGGHDGWGRPL
ncbi:MAG: hypothetical protein OXG35_22360, partial [Acidobacteria bacterium]|nr:hypothetical protein [Acidobacteriota bacterium]